MEVVLCVNLNFVEVTEMSLSLLSQIFQDIQCISAMSLERGSRWADQLVVVGIITSRD